MLELYPFQKKGVEWLVTKNNALLADEMGLGKTVQAVVASHRLGLEQNLIVCPASLKYVWARAIEKWSTSPTSIQIFATGKDVRNGSQWTIVNYELLLNENVFRHIGKKLFDVGVFDEAHYLKNMDSKRTQLILKRGGLASRCKRKWYLTGTPVLNRPVELYPLLKSSAPEVIHPFTSYYGYTRYYCGGFMDGMSWYDRGASHIDELNKKLIESDFMLRRMKEEVLPELPDKTFEIIPIAVDQKPEFAFMWQKDDVTKSNLGDYFSGDEASVGALAEVRHYVALEKIKTAIPHIKNLLLEKEKVVVFAHHKDVVVLLMEGLKMYNPVKVVGGMSAEEKDASERSFQTDPECRVFVGNIKAAGTGLTLTAADTAVFCELDWTPGNMLQATDRIHRIGQPNACLIQMFVTRDSIEEYMLRRLVEKKDVCERILAVEEEIDIFS